VSDLKKGSCLCGRVSFVVSGALGARSRRHTDNRVDRATALRYLRFILSSLSTRGGRDSRPGRVATLIEGAGGRVDSPGGGRVTISVLLVEDHQLVREALRDTLASEPDIDIVGEAGDAGSAFERTSALAPDVVVLDIGLPDMNGIELARRLTERSGVAPKIVALSFHVDRPFVTEMLRAGARGYVTKSSAGTELVRAIRAVTEGQTYLCPDVAGTLVSAVRDGSERSETPHLSPREREVLRLLAQGARSPSIAEQLHISLGTVEVHRRNIMRKLSLHTIADLTRYAMREGMVAP